MKIKEKWINVGKFYGLNVLLNLSNVDIRFVASKFFIFDSVRHLSQLSLETLETVLNNLQHLEKGAKIELTSILRALSKEKKMVRRYFRNEITLYRKLRKKTAQMIEEATTTKPEGKNS